MWDAFTGRLLTTFTNIATTLGPFGPAPVGLSGVFGPDGEILVYIYSNAQHYIAMWNSTLAVLGPATEFAAMSYTPQTSPVTNWMQGIEWNVTIPATVGNPSMEFIDYPDRVLVAEGETGSQSVSPVFEDYGYSTTTGALLWAQNRTNVGWGPDGPGTRDWWD